MAAAYAALVSLKQLIEQIQHHPRPPISLDKEQTQSLTEKVAFLQDFLEAYNFHGVTKQAEELMSRIADAAYAAEDVIESHIVDQIHDQSTFFHGSNIISLRDFFEEADGLPSRIADTAEDIIRSHGVDKSVAESMTRDVESIDSVDSYHGLQKVIEAMDLIKKEVMEIKDKVVPRITTTAGVPSKSHSTEQNTTVGFDDVLKEMLDKLTGETSRRQIIPISGMGGIGKTTLARNVYANSSIRHHFNIRAWVTISQQYDIREILIEVLHCQNNQLSTESLSQMSGKELGEMLYKSLFGRRYLIIIDDMWDVEAWDDVKFYFPENNNGSGIVVTTRISQVVLHFANSNNLKMNFLDEDKSWSLFCENVFGQEDCPDELKKVGKKIARKCKGLPLSIVAIGGLAKSKQTLEYWEFIVENLNLIVNLNDNERCLKILHTSYNELPIHLKPCFLYMGIFPEDSDIDISQLIKQLVAEGFLKPSSSAKSLEETAERYLMDLSDRNLLLVNSTYKDGQRKSFCKIHDLLRDLCIREAEKEKFFCVTSQHSLNIIPQGMSNQRRIASYGIKSEEEYHPQVLHASEFASFTRSLIRYHEGDLPTLGFRLLRVLKAIGKQKSPFPVADFSHLVNSRYLDMSFYHFPCESLPSLYLFWNLQTLFLPNTTGFTAPSELWMMPLLRHVYGGGFWFQDPPSGQTDKQDDFILENLQTLSCVHEFRFSEDVVKRIPNIKQLVIAYVYFEEGSDVASHYCLNNLDRLHKLESLKCYFSYECSASWSTVFLSLPNSLKELTLLNTGLKWEDMDTMIGSLPLLEVLDLDSNSFVGPNWETIEGQFLSLKYLKLDFCRDLEYWMTESTHFPRLEHLVIIGCSDLKEIPSCIGDIPTLKSIELSYCADSVLISAKRIEEEQEEVGNEGLRIHAKLHHEMNAALARNNFRLGDSTL